MMKPEGGWKIRAEGGKVLGPKAIDLTGAIIVMEKKHEDGLTYRLTITARPECVSIRRRHFREGKCVAVLPSLFLDGPSAVVLGEILSAFGSVIERKPVGA